MTKKKVQTELCFSYANLDTDQMNNSLYARDAKKSGKPRQIR